MNRADAAGRNCPLTYRYSPAIFRREPELEAETLYVVGGLYGNSFALDAIFELAEREPVAPTIVFNGDFNWFNIDADGFAALNARVLEHIALRGNVETELANEDESAGCGCGYPEWVGDPEVERSNAIMRRLRETARSFPALRARLGALPMHMVASVGGVRVAIVHGDAWSLAGWGFSQERLREDTSAVAAAFDEADLRVFACSHTCLPVFQALELARGRSLIANNGAAGMPNFRGSRFGLLTRISVHSSAEAPLRRTARTSFDRRDPHPLRPPALARALRRALAGRFTSGRFVPQADYRAGQATALAGGTLCCKGSGGGSTNCRSPGALCRSRSMSKSRSFYSS